MAETRQEWLAPHERWQLALEGSDLAVWDWEVDSGRVFYSSRWWTMLGYGPDEVGDSLEEWSSRVHPDDLAPTMAVIQAHLEGKTPLFISEHRLRAQDGSWRWIQDRGRVSERAADGRPLRAVGTHADITARKQAEAELVRQNATMRWLNEELEKKQALLRIASRAARLGGWSIDLPGWKVEQSEQVVELLGGSGALVVPVEQWLGYHLPAGRTQIEEALRACAQTGAGFDLEYRVRTMDARDVAVRVVGEAVRDPAGRVVVIEGAIQDLTATKAVERSLAESEVRFRQQADTMPLIVWSAEPDGMIDYSNRHFFDYTGVSQELPPASRWQPCVHPEDIGPCLQIWAACVREGKSYATEFRLKRGRDGAYRWFQVQAEPVRDASGRVTKWFGTGVDVHEAKELGIRSAQLAEQLSGVLGSITDGFFSVDREWRFTFMNAEAERQLVAPGSSVLGKVLWEEYPEVVGTRTQRDYEHAVANGVTVRFEEFYPRLGRWLEVRAYPAGGGLSVLFSDITERKEAEEKLREQATLLDKAQDAILVRGMDHEIQYWNQGAERVYGWKASEVLGRSIQDTLYREPAAFLAATELVMSRGEWVGEIDQYTKNGTKITVEGRWTRMNDAEGKPRAIFAINTDITAKKLIEAQFLRAQRMESIGTLAGGIAHDLNNVLAPILLSAELLRDEEDPHEREDLLKLIKTTAQRGADMVQQLLSFARGVEGKRVEVQVRYLVQEVLAMVRETFPKTIQVRTSFPDGLWSVRADPTQIHQVLLNLCVNSRDAMPRGGVLTLSAENVELMESEAGAGRFVVIEVEDTGSGIPQELLDRIFDPFFTTKEVGKGTGLGLSTSLTIVKSHGGFIRVQSEARQWTKFRVYLPAVAGVAVRSVARPSRVPRGSGECVLLVDDEESMREAGRRILEAHGYRVVLAVDGADAIAAYATRLNEVKVVLMDLNMPVLDGASAIRALKRMNPAVKVIATSGRITEDEGGPAEAGWFLQKPYGAEVLLAKITEVLGAGAVAGGS